LVNNAALTKKRLVITPDTAERIEAGLQKDWNMVRTQATTQEA